MKIKYSEYLKQIIDTFKRFSDLYDYNIEQMKQDDLLTTDLLHMIEFGDIGYSERCKLSTKLKNCRLSRRNHKDIIEELEPIVKLMREGFFKEEMRKFEKVLGDIRKVEKKHQNRIYYPRTSEGETYFKECNKG